MWKEIIKEALRATAIVATTITVGALIVNSEYVSAVVLYKAMKELRKCFCGKR